MYFIRNFLVTYQFFIESFSSTIQLICFKIWESNIYHQRDTVCHTKSIFWFQTFFKRSWIYVKKLHYIWTSITLIVGRDFDSQKNLHQYPFSRKSYSTLVKIFQRTRLKISNELQAHDSSGLKNYIKSFINFFTDFWNYTYPSMVPKKDETHGGDDVAVYASGPWSHLFTGNYEQNFIPFAEAYAAQIGPASPKPNSSTMNLSSLILTVPSLWILYMKFISWNYFNFIGFAKWWTFLDSLFLREKKMAVLLHAFYILIRQLIYV